MVAVQACRALFAGKEGRRQSSRRGLGRTTTLPRGRRRTARRLRLLRGASRGGRRNGRWWRRGEVAQQRKAAATTLFSGVATERKRRERDGWELGRIREGEAARRGDGAGLVVWNSGLGPLGLGT
ncbi:unnamed protein product [Linum trigynum]|uniref:Uncharacterized protein n=1 Tax=Linum trigynum TaxID=586398 RepID=A0AAV2ESW5_9ROSI